MAEPRDDAGHSVKNLQSKRPAHPAGATENGQTAASPDTGRGEKPPVSVLRRKQRYLIGLRGMHGIMPSQAKVFLDRLSSMDGVEIERKRRGQPALTCYSSEDPSPPELIVVSMDEQLGEALRTNAPPYLIVEVDASVSGSDLVPLEPYGWQQRARAMPFPRPNQDIRFKVLGDADRPVVDAGVHMFGPGFPTQAMTDSVGEARVRTLAGDPADIQAVYLRPAADYWERYLPNPAIDLEAVNVVRLQPLFRNKSVERPYSWGQRIMKFDSISADWSGVGVKIGLIDSGCDTAHPALRAITHGADLTRHPGASGWKQDELGHGTHCAGIIAGAAAPGVGPLGCAPGAEMHVFKVAPGGYCSDLIEALDLCVERRLDIVQIGVTTAPYSELVAQKIVAMRAQGIACIVGAGNSGGPVQFPGDVPGVLTVGAVGKLGEYPNDTRHAQRALPQLVAPSGLFATYFSCWGPSVSVCAPGVAIISTVPGGGYSAWDGSTMAASHITGLAALLLSHHPSLQSHLFAGRLDQRVAVLFELIRTAAQPIAQADPQRLGIGLPQCDRVPAMFAGFAADAEITTLRLRASGLWM